MKTIDRFNKVFEKFFGREFDKYNQKDVISMNALAYVLTKQDVNLSLNIYFHYNIDQNLNVTSKQLNEYILNDEFYTKISEKLFSVIELYRIKNLYNLVKDLDNKEELFQNVAKFIKFHTQTRYVNEKNFKKYFINTFNFNEYEYEKAKSFYKALEEIKQKTFDLKNLYVNEKDIEF